MFTACTMASIMEGLGVALPGTASTPACDKPFEYGAGNMKKADCIKVADAVFKLLETKTKTRSILTRKSFENGIVICYALGGSTNAILHCITLFIDLLCLMFILHFACIF